MRQMREPRNDFRYREQQTFLNELAWKYELVAYRPDYHAAKGDKNTVLMYLKEDEAHNRTVDRQFCQYSPSEARDLELQLMHPIDEKYVYRDYIFAFENTDINGHLDYGFANFGRIDLRGLDWKEKLEAVIAAAAERRRHETV